MSTQGGNYLAVIKVVGVGGGGTNGGTGGNAGGATLLSTGWGSR